MTSHSLTVAVLTYHRHPEIATIVPALLEHVAAAEERGYRTDLLIVDNDAEGGARPVVAPYLGDGVRYVVEPVPGISAARNRALDEAGGRDLLVFIDDDELPRDGWLVRLLETRERAAAVGVAGAVHSVFDGELDPWLAAGGFFQRDCLPTGTRIPRAATNNLLVDLHVTRAHDLRFDAAFGLSGGEDTMFTARLSTYGPLVWCQEAEVLDRVPSSRMTRRWVLWRALSSGNADSRVDLAVAHGPSARLVARVRAVGDGLIRIAGGLARLAFGCLSGSMRHRARGLRTTARGVGMVTGAFGHAYQAYRRG